MDSIRLNGAIRFFILDFVHSSKQKERDREKIVMA